MWEKYPPLRKMTFAPGLLGWIQRAQHFRSVIPLWDDDPWMQEWGREMLRSCEATIALYNRWEKQKLEALAQTATRQGRLALQEPTSAPTNVTPVDFTAKARKNSPKGERPTSSTVISLRPKR